MNAPRHRRVAALLALGLYALAFVGTLVALVQRPLFLVVAWISMTVASIAAWYIITRRGAARVIASLVAALALIGFIVSLLVTESVIVLVLLVVILGAADFTARYALRLDPASLRASQPAGCRTVDAPDHPVLLMNPKSGGGKVERFHLVEEARRRGIEPVVLGPDDDLEALARDAVTRGADALGMAGGDGSQALVASIAHEFDLPYVCVPAGTRNHLALDLGVDRDDVVGALDAFAHGVERPIDLGYVNGRVFVNNVSLGVYAEIVQSDAYRDDKLGTVASMLPELLGPDTEPFDLRFDGPSGNEHDHADLVLVSNNVYELERLGGFGSRARLDAGLLGIVAVEVTGAAEVAKLVALETAGQVSHFGGWRAWTATSFEIRSRDPIAAGVDGEALRFDSPVRFEIRPGAVRVRIAPHHPGYSPAATTPKVGRGALRRLAQVALGRDAGGPEQERPQKA